MASKARSLRQAIRFRKAYGVHGHYQPSSHGRLLTSVSKPSVSNGPNTVRRITTSYMGQLVSALTGTFPSSKVEGMAIAYKAINPKKPNGAYYRKGTVSVAPSGVSSVLGNGLVRYRIQDGKAVRIK